MIYKVAAFVRGSNTEPALAYKVLSARSVSLCALPLFHSLMLLVHFFSDYANLNTSPSFCEETRLPFSASGGLPLRLRSPRWETAFK